MTDTPSTWLRVGISAEHRHEVIASVGDTITTEEAAGLLGCTIAEVEAELSALCGLAGRCVYCGADVSEDASPWPPVRDDAAWARLAVWHASRCEWIATRAHRRAVQP